MSQITDWVAIIQASLSEATNATAELEVKIPQIQAQNGPTTDETNAVGGLVGEVNNFTTRIKNLAASIPG